MGACLAAPAAASANVPYKQIVSAGPLTRIAIGNDLSCQARLGNDSDFSFYPQIVAPGDCGAFVYTNGNLFGPNFANHTDTGTGASPVATATPFTPVSQSGPTGAGTAASPFQIQTVSRIGTPGNAGSLEITRLDRYVVGTNSWAIRLTIADNDLGSSNADVPVVVYHSGDCYLGGDDKGFGKADPSTGSVFCTSESGGGGRVIGFGPSKIDGVTGANFYETEYDDLWDATFNTLYPNQCAFCTQRVDNAIGVSWAKAVPNGGSIVIDTGSTITPPPPKGKCMSRTATRTGTAAANAITGTAGVDVVAALGGNDTISTLAKGDFVCAGGGADKAKGGGGGDRLRGEKGRDRLVGGGGKDKLTGGAGKDRLVGGKGRDVLNGGPGKDTCVGSAGDRFRSCEKIVRR